MYLLSAFWINKEKKKLQCRSGESWNNVSVCTTDRPTERPEFMGGNVECYIVFLWLHFLPFVGVFFFALLLLLSPALNICIRKKGNEVEEKWNSWTALHYLKTCTYYAAETVKHEILIRAILRKANVVRFILLAFVSSSLNLSYIVKILFEAM